MTNHPQNTPDKSGEWLEAWWRETNGTGTARCPKCTQRTTCTWHGARLGVLVAHIQAEVLAGRLIELDLLEQALNDGRDLEAYKLQRLEDLLARLKATNEEVGE